MATIKKIFTKQLIAHMATLGFQVVTLGEVHYTEVYESQFGLAAYTTTLQRRAFQNENGVTLERVLVTIPREIDYWGDADYSDWSLFSFNKTKETVDAITGKIVWHCYNVNDSGADLGELDIDFNNLDEIIELLTVDNTVETPKEVEEIKEEEETAMKTLYKWTVCSTSAEEAFLEATLNASIADMPEIISNALYDYVKYKGFIDKVAQVQYNNQKIIIKFFDGTKHVLPIEDNRLVLAHEAVERVYTFNPLKDTDRAVWALEDYVQLSDCAVEKIFNRLKSEKVFKIDAHFDEKKLAIVDFNNDKYCFDFDGDEIAVVETPEENFNLQRFSNAKDETITNAKDGFVEATLNAPEEKNINGGAKKEENTMDKEKIIINNPCMLEKAFNAVRVNEHESYDIPTILVNDEGKHIVNSLRVETNFFTQFATPFVATEMLPNVLGGYDVLEHVFMGQLYLQCTSAAILTKFYIKNVDGKVVHNNIYAVNEGGVYNYYILANVEGEIMLCSIADGSTQPMKYLDSRNYWVYDFVGKSSAGELKKNGIMLFGEYHHNVVGTVNKYATYNRKKAMALSNCGSWDMHEKYDSDNEAKKVAKFYMRMAQDMAKASTATEVAPIPSLLISPKKIDVADGMMYGYAPYLCYTFNKCQKQYKVLLEACVGAFNQSRPWSVTKGMILWLTAMLIKEMVMQIVSQFGLVVVNAETASQELRDELFIYMHHGAKKSAFAGKAVLIIWPSAFDGIEEWDTFEYEGVTLPMPALITDFNGLKTSFDIAYKSGIRILNNAHRSHKMGKMSVQLIQSVLSSTLGYAYGNGFLVNLGKAMVAKAIRMNGNTAQEEIGEPEENIELSAMADGIDYRSLLKKVVPNAGKIYYKSAQGDVEKLAEGLLGKINACNYDMPSKAELLMADLAAIFTGKQVLGTREVTFEYEGQTVTRRAFEVYSRDLKPGEIRILNRFPKAGRGEFLVVVGISAEEYYDKMVAADIAEDLAAAICEVIANLTNGIIMIPADPICLKLTGGADFDGDKGMLYKEGDHDDKELVALLIQFTWIMLHTDYIVVDKD